MTREEIEQKLVENEGLVYWVIANTLPHLVGDEDAIQEGRIALWRAIEGYQPEKSKFSTYAAKVILNGIVQWQRRNNRLDRLSTSPIIDELDGLGEGPEYHDLQGFFNSLAKAERKVVRLRMLGFNIPESAQELGVSKAAVQQALARARKKWEEFI